MRLASHFLVLSLGLAGCAAQHKRAPDQANLETNPKELFARGQPSAAAGDMTRAEQYFVAALRAGGDEGVITRRRLGVCAADQRSPVALHYADTYLRHHPDDTELRFARASLYAATGDP